MELDGLKKWAEIIQAAITSIAILAAGIWSFFVFVLGRSYAPNVQIHFQLKKIINYTDGKAVIVSIRIKNIGKTRVLKKNCYVAVEHLPNHQIELSGMSRVDESFDYIKANTYQIFNSHTFFEPDEEAVEDVLFSLDNFPLFRIGVMFIDRHNKNWSSVAIFDANET